MINAAILLPYILACVLFSVVPGPSVSVVVTGASIVPSCRCHQVAMWHR